MAAAVVLFLLSGLGAMLWSMEEDFRPFVMLGVLVLALVFFPVVGAVVLVWSVYSAVHHAVGMLPRHPAPCEPTADAGDTGSTREVES